MDDFDQFRHNIKYSRRLASLSSLPPLALAISCPSPSTEIPSEMQKCVSKQDPSMPVKDEIFHGQQNNSIADHPRNFSSNVLDVMDSNEAPNVLEMSDVLDVSDICSVTDVLLRSLMLLISLILPMLLML
jgi:hypothetical protein